jgi:hypothetical protein
MSYVTDLTMIFPNREDAKRFEALYRDETSYGLVPLASEGSNTPGNYVYTFGLNYITRFPELMEALERGPWARGTVLYICHAGSDPEITVFGPVVGMPEPNGGENDLSV